MSYQNCGSCGLSVPETFAFEEEVQLSTLIADERVDAELDSAIQDRFAFEASHPYEWSDYGFGADCSSFVYD